MTQNELACPGVLSHDRLARKRLTRALVLLLTMAMLLVPGKGVEAALDRPHVYLQRTVGGEFRVVYASPELRKVLSSRSSITAPVLSPNGRQVAFSGGIGDGSLGRFAIYVADVRGSGLQRVTSGSLAEFDPAWSPDGSRIAFSANTSGGLGDSTCCRLATVRSTGGGLTYLTPAIGAVRPSYSPDGETIVFDTPDGIFTIPSSGGSPVLRVTNGRDAVFSADGQRIAYIARSGGRDVLRQTSASGGSSTTVYESNASLESPIWHGDRIYFVEYEGSGYDGRTNVTHRSVRSDGSGTTREQSFLSPHAELDIGENQVFGFGGDPSLILDSNGDNRSDLAHYHTSTGGWVVSESTGSAFSSAVWTSFRTRTGWTRNLSGDFNGDGRDDIANYHPSTGNWVISESRGSSFRNRVWTQFSTRTGWTQNLVGDFNGDGRDDIANYHPSTGNWVISESRGSSFTNQVWNR